MGRVRSMRFSSTTLSGDSSDFDTDRWTEEDLREPPRPKRDWKKAFLVLGLGSLSWVATYVGMLELIQSNMGDLSISHKVIIGFSVCDADDDDHLAAGSDVRAAAVQHEVGVRLRLHLSDAHFRGLRLRLLLEGTREPVGSLPLRGKRCVTSQDGAILRFRTPRSAADNARPVDQDLINQGDPGARARHILSEFAPWRRAASQAAGR